MNPFLGRGVVVWAELFYCFLMEHPIRYPLISDFLKPTALMSVVVGKFVRTAASRVCFTEVMTVLWVKRDHSDQKAT